MFCNWWNRGICSNGNAGENGSDSSAKGTFNDNCAIRSRLCCPVRNTFIPCCSSTSYFSDLNQKIHTTIFCWIGFFFLFFWFRNTTCSWPRLGVRQLEFWRLLCWGLDGWLEALLWLHPWRLWSILVRRTHQVKIKLHCYLFVNMNLWFDLIVIVTAASLPILFIDGAKMQQLNFWYALFPGAAGCVLLCLVVSSLFLFIN